MTDLTHLNALRFRLSNERVRLANAKSEGEQSLSAVWVAGIEKEIAHEEQFSGISAEPDMSDDELLAALPS